MFSLCRLCFLSFFGIFGAEGCALFVFVCFLVDNFADDNFGFDRKLAINRQKIELCTPLGAY